jgi:predicted dehydrogenase
MNKVSVGIVGSQFAATLHGESYKRCLYAEMRSVAAIDNLNEFGDAYNIPNRYKDYHEMFRKENLDLVSVCVPNFLHKEIVLSAVENGVKNIVCEKPLATSVEDGREMVEACKKNGVRLMYAEDWIFAPALIRAKEIVNEGGIGKLLYIKAKESHNGTHSVFAQKKEYCGGGVMIHLGIHPIAFLPFFADSEIAEIVGMKTNGGESNLLHHNYTGEDWAAALLTMENGVRGFVEGNYITSGGMDDKIEIYGTEGNIHIDLTKGSPLHVYSRPGYKYAVEKADFTYGWTQPAVDEFMSLGYVNEIKHFVNCVINNTEPQKGTRGEDGLKALQVTMSLYESAEKGVLVKL